MSLAVIQAKGKPLPPAPAPRAPIHGVASSNDRRPAQTKAKAPTAESDTVRAIVYSVIRRIETHLDEENTALDKTSNFDFKASNDRKSQGLVDLNQALRRLQAADMNADLHKRLTAFREKLAINLRKIRLHLEAVKEITAILSDAMQNAESDGTYTRNIGPYRSAL